MTLLFLYLISSSRHSLYEEYVPRYVVGPLPTFGPSVSRKVIAYDWPDRQARAIMKPIARIDFISDPFEGLQFGQRNSNNTMTITL